MKRIVKFLKLNISNFTYFNKANMEKQVTQNKLPNKNEVLSAMLEIEKLKSNIFIDNKVINENRYKGLEIDFSALNNQEEIKKNSNLKDEEFLNQLKEFLSACNSMKVVSLTITIPPQLSSWINNLVNNEFKVHHCHENNITLTKWLDSERENKIPSQPFTTIGVGAVIFNKNFDFLLVQEKQINRSKRTPKWKFCTGLADVKETILETNEREMFEELGIKANQYNFLGNIYFRFLGPFDKDRVMDLCFFNAIQLKEELLIDNIRSQMCKDEIHDVKYFTLIEIAKLIEEDSELLTYHTKAVFQKLLYVLNPKNSGEENLKLLLSNGLSVPCDQHISLKEEKWKVAFNSIRKEINSKF